MAASTRTTGIEGSFVAEMEVEEKIRAFRASISSNLLASDDFIDWQVIDQHLASCRPAIQHMQHFLDSGDVTRDGLAQLLHQHPSTYPLLLDLIAFNSSGAQVEKWGLPQLISADQARTTWVAGQLMHVGIGKILTTGTAVELLLRVAEVYKDSYWRRFRLSQRARRCGAPAVAVLHPRGRQPTNRRHRNGFPEPVGRASAARPVGDLSQFARASRCGRYIAHPDRRRPGS